MMTTFKLLRWLPVAALVAAPCCLNAQSTGTATTSGANDPAIKMNPFEVTTEKNNGFQSANASMGSRLAIDLRDAPVPYSVINREMIDALGINNLLQAASWATGQTWISTDNGQDAGGTPQQYIARGNKENTSADIASMGNQRNFYQNANLSSDSYSVESFDFGRGPNASLFGTPNGGTGGLGGVSSAQTKKARFDRTIVSLGLEWGMYHYKRGSLDINRPVNDKWSIRLNTVYHDQDAYREREMQQRKNIDITNTFKPTATTEIRLEGTQEHSFSHNVGTGWDDGVSGWDGKTYARGAITDSMLSTTATPGQLTVANASYGGLAVLGTSTGLTFSGQPNGVGRLPGAQYTFDPYTGTIMNYQNMLYSRGADRTSRVPVWTKTAPDGVSFVRANMGINGNMANGSPWPSFGLGRSFHAKQAVPQDMFDRAIANSRFRIPDFSFTSTLDKPVFEQHSKSLTLTITQRITPSLYAELGADTNKNKNWNWNEDSQGNQANGADAGLGHRTGEIDLNALLPNGAPNPHFLDVINQATLSHNDRETKDSTLRLNFGYNKDLGRWGNYVFNLNGNASQRSQYNKNYTMSMKLNADSRLWSGESVKINSWWSDPVKAYTDPSEVGATFINTDWTSANNPVLVAPVHVKPAYVATTWNKSLIQNRYGLFQVTGRYWDNRVIFIGAARRDYSKAVTHNNPLNGNALATGELPVGWDGNSEIYRPDAPADYFQLTYIKRNATTGAVIGTGLPVPALTRPRTTIGGISVRNPLFANDRFRDDYNAPVVKQYGNTYTSGLTYHALRWASLGVNWSDTYTPPTAISFDYFGNQKSPVTAYGWDFGPTFSFFNNNFSAKLTKYINVREHSNFDSTVRAPVNTLYQSNAVNNLETDVDQGRNSRGVADLPANGDYQNLYTYGYEAEIAANNITPGWRMTLNASDGARKQTERGEVIKAYVPQTADVFKQILEDAGGRLDTSAHPTGAPNSPGLAVLGTVPAGSSQIDQQQAVDAYNNIWIQYQQLLDQGDGTLTRDTPTINFFTDYTIQSGKLRGLRFGAGWQWQGRMTEANLGSQTIVDPTNPLTAIDDPTVNANNFLRLKGSYRTTGSIGYNFNLKNGTVVALNLVIDNLTDNRDVVYGEANMAFGTVNRNREGDLTKPNRSPMPDVIGRFNEPINFRLSSTFTFGVGRR